MKYLLVGIVFLLFACGTNATDSRHDSIEQTKDSLRAEADRKDKQKQCCFQSAEEFAQFLPDSLGGFHKHNSEAQFPCADDTLSHNSIRAEYIDDRGHMIAVNMTEYCTSPFMLASDYSLKYEMRKSTAEFNEFDIPPTHHGFSTYDQKKAIAYVLVEVDERFLVEITDQVCKNTGSVLEIYAALPLNKLAAFAR